jgi:isopenicillin-N epimerase
MSVPKHAAPSGAIPPIEWNLDPAVAHLNHGSFGAVPRAVLEEQRKWAAIVDSNPTAFFWRRFPEEMARVRRTAAAFVGAAPERCMLVPNVTTGFALIMSSVALAAGDQVLVTADTYPAVRAAAERACERSGATVIVAPLPADDLTPGTLERAFLAQVTDRTRLAIIDHITSPTAVLVDVTSLTRTLRARGVCVAIDGAHAPGNLNIDVDSIGADFYNGNFHKWCCAPRGSALLVVGREYNGRLGPAITGSRFEEGFPTGFEWWGTADYTAMLATPKAFELFERIGWSRVRGRNTALLNEGMRVVAAALGIPAPRDAVTPMTVVRLPDPIDSDATAHRLREDIAHRGVEVTIAGSRGAFYLRTSCHLYNDLADFNRLATALSELLPQAGMTEAV